MHKGSAEVEIQAEKQLRHSFISGKYERLRKYVSRGPNFRHRLDEYLGSSFRFVKSLESVDVHKNNKNKLMMQPSNNRRSCK